MKITFGKFTGVEIKRINKSYLGWLLTLDNLQDDIRTEIENVLKAKIKESSEEDKEKSAAETIIDLGKYKGLRIAEIYDFDISYLNYLIKNNNYLSDIIVKAFKEIRESKNKNKTFMRSDFPDLNFDREFVIEYAEDCYNYNYNDTLNMLRNGEISRFLAKRNLKKS